MKESWRPGDVETINVVVVGTGGQGVMTATGILAAAAIACGHDVKQTAFAGVARRGGVVAAHLRFGRRVLSPQVTPGTADLLLAFEAAEAMRACHMLRAGGIALVNSGRVVPPVVDLGLYDYPEDPVAAVRASGRRVVSFDASALASELGEPRLGNIVMLGAIADELPFSAALLEACVRERFATKTPAIAVRNRAAFAAGRKAAARSAPGVLEYSDQPA